MRISRVFPEATLRVLAPALLGVMLSILPLRASAQETVHFGITPYGRDGPFFALTMQPGERQILSVTLQNFGGPATARTYAADAYSLINGGFGAKLADEPKSGATLWLDYSTEALELPPNSATVKDFTVTVPADTPPGEYLTSLVIQNNEPLSTNNSMLTQVIRQVIAVAISLPGPRTPGLGFGEVRYKPFGASSASVLVEVKNTGNVRLKPSGEIVLQDSQGDEILRQPVQMDSVYAGTSTYLEVGLPQRLPPGDYTVSVTLEGNPQPLFTPTPPATPSPVPATPGAAPTAEPIPQISATSGPLHLVVPDASEAGSAEAIPVPTPADQ